MSDAIEVAIRPPKLDVSDKEAQQIMDELGVGAVSPDSVARPLETGHLIKLGRFVEGSGVVPLDHGAILLTRQVMLRHMLRLEQLAQEVEQASASGVTEDTFQRMKDLTYMMGYLGTNIGKISTIGIKTKVAAELAAQEAKRNRQPTWAPGAVIQNQPGGVVQLGVAESKPAA